eukprot:m.84744 g.84744  ORF g.84744 m.84744 type:complete len:907 (-) comp8717_c0_seq1:204-2924(-)
MPPPWSRLSKKRSIPKDITSMEEQLDVPIDLTQRHQFHYVPMTGVEEKRKELKKQKSRTWMGSRRHSKRTKKTTSKDDIALNTGSNFSGSPSTTNSLSSSLISQPRRWSVSALAYVNGSSNSSTSSISNIRHRISFKNKVNIPCSSLSTSALHLMQNSVFADGNAPTIETIYESPQPLFSPSMSQSTLPPFMDNAQRARVAWEDITARPPTALVTAREAFCGMESKHVVLAPEEEGRVFETINKLSEDYRVVLERARKEHNFLEKDVPVLAKSMAFFKPSLLSRLFPSTHNYDKRCGDFEDPAFDAEAVMAVFGETYEDEDDVREYAEYRRQLKAGQEVVNEVAAVQHEVAKKKKRKNSRNESNRNSQVLEGDEALFGLGPSSRESSKKNLRRRSTNISAFGFGDEFDNAQDEEGFMQTASIEVGVAMFDKDNLLDVLDKRVERLKSVSEQNRDITLAQRMRLNSTVESSNTDAAESVSVARISLPNSVQEEEDEEEEERGGKGYIAVTGDTSDDDSESDDHSDDKDGLKIVATAGPIRSKSPSRKDSRQDVKPLDNDEEDIEFGFAGMITDLFFNEGDPSISNTSVSSILSKRPSSYLLSRSSSQLNSKQTPMPTAKTPKPTSPSQSRSPIDRRDSVLSEGDFGFGFDDRNEETKPHSEQDDRNVDPIVAFTQLVENLKLRIEEGNCIKEPLRQLEQALNPLSEENVAVCVDLNIGRILMDCFTKKECEEEVLSVCTVLATNDKTCQDLTDSGCLTQIAQYLHNDSIFTDAAIPLFQIGLHTPDVVLAHTNLDKLASRMKLLPRSTSILAIAFLKRCLTNHTPALAHVTIASALVALLQTFTKEGLCENECCNNVLSILEAIKEHSPDVMKEAVASCKESKAIPEQMENRHMSFRAKSITDLTMY